VGPDPVRAPARARSRDRDRGRAGDRDRGRDRGRDRDRDRVRVRSRRRDRVGFRGRRSVQHTREAHSPITSAPCRRRSEGGWDRRVSTRSVIGATCHSGQLSAPAGDPGIIDDDSRRNGVRGGTNSILAATFVTAPDRSGRTRSRTRVRVRVRVRDRDRDRVRNRARDAAAGRCRCPCPCPSRSRLHSHPGRSSPHA
jgi:hypothetical protein